MIINVQNTGRPDVSNRSHANIWYGETSDFLEWPETPGYYPLPVKGFSQWEVVTSIMGDRVYICRSL